MRRLLPRTLLLARHASRPAPHSSHLPFKRYQSDKIPHLTYSPMSEPPLEWTHSSSTRTAPHKVTERRTRWPTAPSTSATPLLDPELRSTDPTKKQMPLKTEMDFERYRARGLLPGPIEQAKVDYMESMSRYRSRVRGVIWEVWDKYRRDGQEVAEMSWVNRSKIGFLYAEALRRGKRRELEEQRRYRPLEGYDLWRNRDQAQRAMPTSEGETGFDDELAIALDVQQGELIRSEVEKYVEQSPEQPHAEGSELPEDDILDHVEDEIILKHPEVVDWGAYNIRTEREVPLDHPARLPVRERVVGYRLYLPNVSVIMLRNHTPFDEPYDPMVASFRIPMNMTKSDLRSYLKAAYDLDVTFIRTELRRGSIGILHGRRVRLTGSEYNHKRAVVGLYEPFHYPDDLEELQSRGHQARVGDEWMNKCIKELQGSFDIKSLNKRRAEHRSEEIRQGLTLAQSAKERGGYPDRRLRHEVSRKQKLRNAAVSLSMCDGRQKLMRPSRQLWRNLP